MIGIPRLGLTNTVGGQIDTSHYYTASVSKLMPASTGTPERSDNQVLTWPIAA